MVSSLKKLAFCFLCFLTLGWLDLLKMENNCITAEQRCQMGQQNMEGFVRQATRPSRRRQEEWQQMVSSAQDMKQGRKFCLLWIWSQFFQTLLSSLVSFHVISRRYFFHRTVSKLDREDLISISITRWKFSEDGFSEYSTIYLDFLHFFITKFETSELRQNDTRLYFMKTMCSIFATGIKAVFPNYFQVAELLKHQWSSSGRTLMLKILQF